MLRITGLLIAASGIAIFSPQVSADEGDWYVTARAGLNLAADNDFSFVDNGALGIGDGAVSGNFDNGFTFGGAVGRKINQNWAVEIDWPYQANDASDLTFPNGSAGTSAQIASTGIYLNAVYSAPQFGGERWTPYVGAGIGYIDEVSFDVTVDGTERSFASDSDVSWQAFAGARYQLDKDWSVSAELRYLPISDVDMKEEAGLATRLNGISHDSTSFQLGLRYDF